MKNDDVRRQHEYHGDGESIESSERRHRHRHSSSRYWIAPLVIATVIETFLIVGLLVWVNRAEQANREHLLREQDLVQKIEDGKNELEKVKAEFDKFKTDKIKTHLTNLTPLKMDQVMEINKEYVKSAIFMMVGKKDNKYFEYKLVLENKTTSDIFPKIEILFFNNTGYQVGSSRIGYAKDGAPSREILEKGEIRSFGSTLEVSDDEEPQFFMVRINKD